MSRQTVVEFTYKPSEYLEAPVTQADPAYGLEIDQGRARATLTQPADPAPPDLTAEIRRRVEAVLGARQVRVHQPYRLDDTPRIEQHGADGSRSVVMFAASAVVSASVCTADAIITDASGKVVFDSKADRIAVDRAYMDTVARAVARDPLVLELFRSYQAAVEDGADELLHLYEIRDALAKRYRGDAKARAALGISRPDWSRLGTLANVEPLEQGRHRGEHAGRRREATADELSEARAIAKRLIDAFVRAVLAAP